MLPFDRKPWARAVASVVVALSIAGAVCLALYFHNTDDLHIPEVVGIVLLLLTIVPPNLAIVLRKPGQTDPNYESPLIQRRPTSRY